MILLVQGCASTPSVSQLDIIDAATPAFGESFKLFFIPSRGAFMDAEFIALSKISPNSGHATTLAAILSSASDSKLNIAVGGPNSPKTAIVIQNAITLQQGRSLPFLHLVFVGNPADSQGTAESVISVGAKYSFVPYGL